MKRYIHLHDQRRPLGAIAFDLDGTLTKPYLDFGQLRAQLGLAEGDILKWVDALSPSAQHDACRAIEAFELDGVENVEWNEGAPETFRTVQAMNLPVAIITRNSRASLQAVCRRLGLAADLLITREDAPPKPHPAGLHLVGGQFGVPLETVLMVGDFRHDIEAGRAAGAMTVLLTNGRNPAWPVEADLIVARLPDLLHYLS